MQFIWGLLFSKMFQNADTLYWEPSLPRLPHKYIEPKKQVHYRHHFFLLGRKGLPSTERGDGGGGEGGVCEVVIDYLPWVPLIDQISQFYEQWKQLPELFTRNFVSYQAFFANLSRPWFIG